MTNNLINNYKPLLKFVSSFYYSKEIEFDYQVFKETASGQRQANSLYEEMKSIMDCLFFIINNKENQINYQHVKKIIVLLDQNVDDIFIQEIVNLMYEYNNETIVVQMVKIITILSEKNYFSNQNINELFPLILAMTIFYQNKGYFIRFNRTNMKIILNLIKSKDETKLENEIIELIFNTHNDNNYYKNLAPLILKEIYDELNKEKDFIKNNYKINTIYIFGSFSHNNQRIDSDIDLLLVLDRGYTFKEKQIFIERFKEFILIKFKRSADILEYSKMLNDEQINEFKDKILIFG